MDMRPGRRQDDGCGAEPSRRMEPARDVRCFMLGNRSVLFSERLQQLFELNDSAATIWRAIVAGEPVERVAESFVGQGIARGMAMDFVADAISEWVEAGLLVPHGLIDLARGTPDVRFHLRVGTFDCRLDMKVGSSDPLPGIVRSIFAQFMTEPAADSSVIAVVEEGDGYFLLFDGAVVGMFTAERIVPELKALLTDRLAMATDEGSFLIHAAMLAHDGRGVLLSGPPGAGKTTLSVALAAQGWDYAADDIIRVSPRLGFEGVRFGPASKSGAWGLLRRYVPRLLQLPVHLRRDGQKVRYLPVEGWRLPKVDSVAWGFLLARQEGASAVLEPVEPLAFLSDILRGAFSAPHRLQGEALLTLIDRLSSMSCRRLIYSDLTAAVGLLRETVHA